MRFDQLLVSASPGDAVTNAAFEIRRLLRLVGPSEIYAKYIHADLLDEVLVLDQYGRSPSRSPGSDVLLFHSSIGEPIVHAFVMERPERIVLVYHNISPSRPFLPFDPGFAGLLEGGRRELADVRDRVTCALAVSEFNARELRDLGFPDVRVSPLIVDVPALLERRPDPQTTRRLEDDWDGPTVLFVGQLLPHKRPDLLLEAFHVLQTYLVPEARLALVGPDRLRPYAVALRALAAELHLDRAALVGPVSGDELVAYYRRADVFVTVSEHEGFCVPPLEAMAFGVPIVARDHGAIAETLGGAGLLLPADAGATLVAEAMAALIEDGALRAGLVERGEARLAAYDPERARTVLLEHLLSVA